MSNLQPYLQHSLKHGRFSTYTENPREHFQNRFFLECKQVHSANIIEVKQPEHHNNQQEADGLIFFFNELNLGIAPVLAIKTADCLPIAIIGQKGVALIHAGWRGLKQDILSHQYIKHIDPIEAYIGPHIGQNSYEVSEEFEDHFAVFQTQALIKKHDKLFFNLGQFAQERLTTLFPGIDIQNSKVCTYSTPELHSHRQNQTKQRNWNIWIP